ncbi:hypothetical protein E4U43_001859 [Claviceps pusilla]|uniref:Secreted protein n=1 Tax=Claviceps pusilla TaxID=123648 RepID=A0A9P7N7P1_9HYPO|nr:hypothetical protein E4U43_001859 [Claviceps pusilla]
MLSLLFLFVGVVVAFVPDVGGHPSYTVSPKGPLGAICRDDEDCSVAGGGRCQTRAPYYSGYCYIQPDLAEEWDHGKGGD